MAQSRVPSRILDRYVLGDERVVVAIRHHWGKLVEPVGTTLLGAVLAVWLSANAPPDASALPLVAWWLWFALVLRLVWKLLEWRNEWFVATDKRLLMTYGLITHKVAMMPLRKVTDMNYARSPLGRILGYGQFVMESAGQDQAMREINWVPDPDQTYRRICDTIFGPEGHDPDEDVRPLADQDAESGQYAGSDGRRSDGEPAWEVSHDDEPSYAPVGYWEDPDITGPIPRVRRR